LGGSNREALTAIGTIGMAFVIVLIELILLYFKKPRLKIEFEENNQQYCREASLSSGYKVSYTEEDDITSSTAKIIAPSDIPTNLTSSPGSTSIHIPGLKESDFKAISLSQKRPSKSYFIRLKVINNGRGVVKDAVE